MKALLLAAGLGTRLRPFTYHRAKAALPLLNIPFIRYPLHNLTSKGIEEIVINLHAHPQTVQDAAGTEYGGVPIRYSHEPTILGTAGAIGKARELLGDQPFVVMNGDMICDPPFQHMLEQHQRSGALVTLMVMRGENFSRYGSLAFDQSDAPRVLPPGEQGEKLHFTGVQIVSPEIFPHIPPQKKSEIFIDIYPPLIREGKIHGYIYEGIWMEIGTLKDYLHTANYLLENPLPEHLRPVGIGESNVSPGAKIENGSSISGSIVMDGAKIKSGVRVEHSIIGWDVSVDRDANGVALARGILPWTIQQK